MTSTAAPPQTRRRLTGLKPTGHLQLGNLISAIRPMVVAQSQPTATTETIVPVVDLHALTIDHRPHEVRALTLEHVTTLLAAGLDPTRTLLYVQSQVPEHTELHYLLECVTSYGEARRMTQFKDKSGAQQHVRLSLLTYPVLMAADILLHDTDEVPVGDDQTQHLELTRDVALRFNTRYGETFTVPRVVHPDVGTRIMDLANPAVKMGKSTAERAGVLYLLDPPDTLRRKINQAVLDSDGEVYYDPMHKPGVSNLLEILVACTGGDAATAATDLTSYGQLKTAVLEAVVGMLTPMQRRYGELVHEQEHVREVLRLGATRARERATTTVTRTRRALGLLPG